MKKIAILLFLITVTFAVSAQSGWQNMTSNYTNSLNDVIVINDTAAICVGGSATVGHVLGTGDAGISWSATLVSSTSLNAAALSSTGLWVVGDSGKLFYSSNGTSWSAASSGTTSNLNDIQFSTSSTAYVVGDGGAVIKTTNSGMTWSNPVSSGTTTNNINALYFTSDQNGVIGGNSNGLQGFTKRTINGAGDFGADFQTLSIINDIYFINPSLGYAVGKGGNIFKTVNGGASWSFFSSGLTSNLNSISFADTTYGYIVGDGGAILKTTDGGTTWTQQSSPTTQNLYGVSALDSNIVYAVGEAGTIIRTLSGGAYLNVNVNDESVYCNAYVNLIAHTSYSGNGNLTFSWASSPNLSNTNDSLAIVGPLTSSETFYVTVSDGVLTATDSAVVSIVALPPDSICLVTIDEAIGSNVIVFEKHIQGAIDYYNIYSESSVAGVYDSIGFIPADSAGVFVDVNSNPAVKAYSYKISTVDSCGNESLLSDNHTTMHLSINQGSGSSWNLIWNFYEGIPVQTYRIWRADTSLNWTKIDSVPGTNSSYTDLNPPAGGLYYQVEIISPYMCQPYNYKANTNYNTSRSNTANNGLVNPALNADFSGDVISGNIPLVVQFTNQTTGVPSTYLWDFGDGDTSSVENPIHTYTVEGTYTVKLIVSDGSTIDSIIKLNYIDALPNGFNDINAINNISIFPNPLSNNQSLYIKHQGVNINKIQVMDILGKAVDFSITNNTNQSQIEFNKISKGIYFISIFNKQGLILQKKFIIK